jgi:Holliday junction resolvase-like predicted endonuclease
MKSGGKVDTAYKKILGKWGEEQVDIWMEKHNWLPIEKNLRIHGGEIDRVYTYSNGTHSQFCIAEVKTNLIYSKNTFTEIFSEVGIKKYIKQRQIRNLYKFGENYLAKGKKNIFLRLFIVIKLNNKLKINDPIKSTGSIKICFSNDSYFIISIEPEFTNLRARKSLLQIRL